MEDLKYDLEICQKGIENHEIVAKLVCNLKQISDFSLIHSEYVNTMMMIIMMMMMVEYVVSLLCVFSSEASSDECPAVISHLANYLIFIVFLT